MVVDNDDDDEKTAIITQHESKRQMIAAARTNWKAALDSGGGTVPHWLKHVHYKRVRVPLSEDWLGRIFLLRDVARMNWLFNALQAMVADAYPQNPSLVSWFQLVHAVPGHPLWGYYQSTHWAKLFRIILALDQIPPFAEFVARNCDPRRWQLFVPILHAKLWAFAQGSTLGQYLRPKKSDGPARKPQYPTLQHFVIAVARYAAV